MLICFLKNQSHTNQFSIYIYIRRFDQFKYSLLSKTRKKRKRKRVQFFIRKHESVLRNMYVRHKTESESKLLPYFTFHSLKHFRL